MILKVLRYKVAHVAVTKKHAKLSGDLNVQNKGPSELRLSFPPNIYLLLRKKKKKTTNLTDSFFSRCTIQQRDFDGVNIIK